MRRFSIGYLIPGAEKARLFGPFDSEEEIAGFLGRYGWAKKPEGWSGLECWIKDGTAGAWIFCDYISGLSEPISEIPEDMLKQGAVEENLSS